MSQPLQRVPDPVIYLKDCCGRCGNAVELRVLEGSGAPQNRGCIAQKCINYQCNWTLIHTPAYAYNDAKHLLQRIITRSMDPGAYPGHFTAAGAALHLAPSTPEAPPRTIPSISCAAGKCRPDGQKVSQGNRECVGLMCKTCCLNASDAALQSRTLRQYCKAHKAPGYEGEPAPGLPAAGPVTPPRTQPIAPQRNADQVHQAALQTLENLLVPFYAQLDQPVPQMPPPPEARAAAPAPAPAPAPALPPPPPVPPLLPRTQPAPPSLRLTVQRPQSSATSPSVDESPGSAVPVPPTGASNGLRSPVHAGPPTKRARPPGKGLAMPLTDAWQKQYQLAQDAQELSHTVKTASEELTRKVKVNVMFVIWCKAGQAPQRWEEPVMTFPRVQLAALPRLIEVFALSDSSIIERLDLAERYWVGGSIQSVFTVDNTRRVGDSSPRVLLRIRADLGTPFSENDCPELDIELQRLGYRSKRRLEECSSSASSHTKVARMLPQHSEGRNCTPHVPRLAAEGPVDGDDMPPVRNISRSSPTSSNINHESAAPSTVAHPSAVTVKVEDSGCGPSLGRKWPLDFTVKEVSDGFKKMHELVKNDPLGKLTKAKAFPLVFGVRWTHSTHYKYEKIWSTAPQELRRQFLLLGQQPEGKWSAFLAALKAYSSSGSFPAASGTSPSFNNISSLASSPEVTEVPAVTHISVHSCSSSTLSSDYHDTANFGVPTRTSLSSSSEHDDLEYLDESVPDLLAEHVLPTPASNSSFTPPGASPTSGPSTFIPPRLVPRDVTPSSTLTSSEPDSASSGFIATSSTSTPSPSRGTSDTAAASSSLEPTTSTPRQPRTLAPWPLDGMSVPSTRSVAALSKSQSAEELREMELDPDADMDDNSEGVALCSFCDEELPDVPSPALAAMRFVLQAKSWSDPDYDNKDHRAYAMKDSEVFDLYCREHRRESFLAREAARYPEPLDFRHLDQRIVQLTSQLTALLCAPHENEFYIATMKKYKPRSSAHQLQSLMQGATAGYYGSKGYCILFHLLLHIFRPATIRGLDACHGLDSDTFVANVLVPEAATLLIQQDLSLSRLEAAEKLKESHRYGKTVYPLSDNDPDVDHAMRVGRGLGNIHSQAVLAVVAGARCTLCSPLAVDRTAVVGVKVEEPDIVLPSSPSKAVQPGSPPPGFVTTQDVHGNVVYELVDEDSE
ncbi:hypothetical protein OH77DRAFT_1508140 [Trametes cingulata]|nr:hypothetical protein OH77DRAFT_1508140 [Trametes cingulata]